MLRHGELASAKLLLSRADTIIERVRAEGATHQLNDANMLRLLTVTLNNTACVHRREGRMEEALCYLEDALNLDASLATRARHERSADAACLIGPNASALLLNLSTVLAALGRWEEARMRAEGAITCVWSFDTHWQSPHVRASLVHLSLCVSSYAFYHICVRIVLYMCPYTHTNTYVSSYVSGARVRRCGGQSKSGVRATMCPYTHTTIYVYSILLYTCPHTTTCMSGAHVHRCGGLSQSSACTARTWATRPRCYIHLSFAISEHTLFRWQGVFEPASACLCACVRACVRACMCGCGKGSLSQRVRASL